MTNNERILANNAELRECIELAETLPDAGTSVEVVLQSKTVTPTKSVQEVTADASYTALEKVTVEAIPGEYITTDDATAESAEIFSGETAYVNGEKVTGSFTIANELAEQDELLTELETVLAGKAAGGGSSVAYDTCTVRLNNQGLSDDCNMIFVAAMVIEDGAAQCRTFLRFR